ncbi:hypothetical protein T281_07320 [Rhodomicrobium udaipurense JA643]|nr:hypothetical protein T281_07320 [Rhodomicrobium udaipurense JA643]
MTNSTGKKAQLLKGEHMTDRDKTIGVARVALKRLVRTLDAENNALVALDARHIGEFSAAKTESLLELHHIGISISAQALPDDLRPLVDLARQKLDLNQWLLLMHLDAARAITATIMHAICDSESDGTYSRSIIR